MVDVAPSEQSTGKKKKAKAEKALSKAAAEGEVRLACLSRRCEVSMCHGTGH